MKKLLRIFFQRNLAFFRIGIQTNIEYRVNFLTDAVIQPSITAAIEMMLWFAVFYGANKTEIGGFTREYYLSYALWGAFLARVASNWMYEFRMIDEIDTGSINTILARPITFFEYYWSQFFGYKMATTIFSIFVPVVVDFFMNTPTILWRIPLAFMLTIYYIFFLFILSTITASLAFRFNRIHSAVVAKNLFLWLLSGELFPLDLAPEPFKGILLNLPFCSGIYRPVAYLTGRFGIEIIVDGFISVSYAIVIAGLIAHYMWRTGIKRYTGTGA